MIKNVIFDIGKVLVDYDSDAYVKSYGFPAEEEEAIRTAVFGGPVWKDVDRGAKPLALIRKELTALLPADYREDALRVFDHYGPAIRRLDYAGPWISELKERGYKVYYLSNYADWMIESSRPALDFLPLMDGGLFSYEAKSIKPEPEIYRAFLARYPSVLPEESVFLDDVPANIAAARALGFSGIVFSSRSQAQEELEVLLK